MSLLQIYRISGQLDILSFRESLSRLSALPGRKSEPAIGILQIGSEFCLKTSEVTLPSLNSPSRTSVDVYEPRLHLNLSELSPALLQGQKLMDMPRTSEYLVEDVADKEDDYKETEGTLDQLENQLNEISFQRRTRTRQMILTHGSYIGIGFLSMGLLAYLCRTKALAGATSLWHCLQQGSKQRTQKATRERQDLINL